MEEDHYISHLSSGCTQCTVKCKHSFVMQPLQKSSSYIRTRTISLPVEKAERDSHKKFSKLAFRNFCFVSSLIKPIKYLFICD